MRKLSAFIRNLSVSWKFIFTYYIVLIIPMALFGVYFYMRASDDSISQAKLVMERNLLQTRASIMQKVTVIENVSSIIASNTVLKSTLYYDYKNENERVTDFQFNVTPTLGYMYRQNPPIYAIRIYTPKTVYSLMANSYYSIRKKDSPEWYDKAVLSMPIGEGWVSSHNSPGNVLRDQNDMTVQVFSYSRFIISPASQESMGLVEIELEESQLLDMLRDPVINKWGKIFVADMSGTIVSNNIPQYYTKNILDLGFKDFDTEGSINKIEKIENKDSIVIKIPVDEIGCSIVGIFPVDKFNVDARKSIVNLLIVLGILSIVLGTIVYFLTNLLMRRVKRLVKAMKQVRDNHLDVSVPVNSMDEFGELTLNFNHMTGRIHELVETVYKIQLMEREAELKALEAQINPHFLYNTLATISWVARKGSPEEVVKISNSLAKFYRLVLSKGGTLINVRDEIEMVRSYLQIQKIRFEDMFDVVYELDEAAMDCVIVKSLLQPLVENALNHGIEPKRNHGLLIIRSEMRQNLLTLEIIDDGVGMDSRTLSDVLAGRVERSGGSGYAVKNVIGRLAAYYGDSHTFHIFSKPGIGTQITIQIRVNEDGNPISIIKPVQTNIASGGTLNA